MEVKKSLPLAAALLALGITGPAAALASDGESEHSPSAGSVVSAPVSHPGDDQSDDSAAEEQRSGEPGDDQNSDLASEVEQEDATSTDDHGEDHSDHSATPTGDSQSDDQDDQANSDLAAEVEQEDGAASGDTSQETEVEDSNDD